MNIKLEKVVTYEGKWYDSEGYYFPFFVEEAFNMMVIRWTDDIPHFENVEDLNKVEEAIIEQYKQVKDE